jgi:hypothetical protein
VNVYANAAAARQSTAGVGGGGRGGIVEEEDEEDFWGGGTATAIAASLKDTQAAKADVGRGVGESKAGGGDDDNFWDFKEEPKKEEKKKESKGGSKTLNRSQADQFSKWCFAELEKLTGSDDTTLGEFLMSLHSAAEVLYLFLCVCVVSGLRRHRASSALEC